MPPATILIVEDEGIVALDIQKCLRRLGYHVPAVAATGEEALRQAEAERPDLVLIDIKLRGSMDGTQVAEAIQSRVIYLTAYSDEPTLARAQATNPFGYLLKPFDERELQAMVELALGGRRIEE